MARTTFDPKIHGYQFANIAASAWGNVGVCGGMSWSAVDYFFHPSAAMPSYDNASFPNGVLVGGWKPTANDATLADYIWRRQMDSVNANGGGFLLALTQPPKSTANYTRLKQLLDAGVPTPIALPSTGSNVFEGHHVVAIDYQEGGGNKDILIYDPNRPDETALLRIVADDKLTEHTTTFANGTWTAGAAFDTWKGFWIADGFEPQTPPGGLEDIILTSIAAPSVADSATAFDVTFVIANVGEFETPVYSVGLRIDGNVLAAQIPLPGGRLPLSHTFAPAAFNVQLGAGVYTLAPIYYTHKNGPHRSLGVTRKVVVAQGFPKGSSLQLGGLEGKQRVSPELGKLISGPTLFKPYVPFVYEVKEYKVGLKLWIEDDYGGGTFVDPMTTVTATLDNGQALRGETVKIVGPREATYEARYDPTAAKDSTVLRVTVIDKAGAAYDAALAVPCSKEETVPPLDLGHGIPDFGRDPFGHGPFGRGPLGSTPVGPVPPRTGVTPIDPRLRFPRR